MGDRLWAMGQNKGQRMAGDDFNRDGGDKGGGVNTAPAYPLFIIPCIPFIPDKLYLFVF